MHVCIFMHVFKKISHAGRLPWKKGLPLPQTKQKNPKTKQTERRKSKYSYCNKTSVFETYSDTVISQTWSSRTWLPWAQCVLVIIIIIIIIIIAFKGAIRDFLQSPHSAANCLQNISSSGPGATVCKSRATHRTLITCKCHVTCHLVRRDSSATKFDRVEIAFIWALFCWLNH